MIGCCERYGGPHDDNKGLFRSSKLPHRGLFPVKLHNCQPESRQGLSTAQLTPEVKSNCSLLSLVVRNYWQELDHSLLIFLVMPKVLGITLKKKEKKQ